MRENTIPYGKTGLTRKSLQITGGRRQKEPPDLAGQIRR